MQDKLFSLILVITLFAALSPSEATAQKWRGSIIRDPDITTRCVGMQSQRREKIDHRRRLISLVRRNAELQKTSPKNRVSVRKRLLKNYHQLNHELRLATMKLHRIEEKLLRKGCPTLTF